MYSLLMVAMLFMKIWSSSCLSLIACWNIYWFLMIYFQAFSLLNVTYWTDMRYNKIKKYYIWSINLIDIQEFLRTCCANK